MKKLMQFLAAHVWYWGESYVQLPLVMIGLLLSIVLVGLATGRPVLEDVGSLVGWLLQSVGVAVVASLAGLTQHFLFGYRSNSPAPTLADDIHDSCVTCFLLLLYSALVFGLVR